VKPYNHNQTLLTAAADKKTSITNLSKKFAQAVLFLTHIQVLERTPTILTGVFHDFPAYLTSKFWDSTLKSAITSSSSPSQFTTHNHNLIPFNAA
jgi:hypothetical protein